MVTLAKDSMSKPRIQRKVSSSVGKMPKNTKSFQKNFRGNAGQLTSSSEYFFLCTWWFLLHRKCDTEKRRGFSIRKNFSISCYICDFGQGTSFTCKMMIVFQVYKEPSVFST